MAAMSEFIQGGEAGSNFQLLLAQAKGGDTEAAGKLLCASGKRLWRIAYSILQHEEDAKDVVQETFLKAFRSLKGLRASDQKGWEVWLMRIAANCAKDKRSVRTPLAPLGVEPPEWVDDGRLPLEDHTVLNLRLQALLRRLPFGKRTSVVLVFMCGWTRKDAARVLGVPRGTVDSWLFDARRELRKALEPQHD